MPNDPIPLEDRISFSHDEYGITHCEFYAFNTCVSLSACECADDTLLTLRDRCRVFERMFSRTLPNSDITRINKAAGEPVVVSPETYELVELALHYCDESRGLFDVTIGAVSRLWDFHHGHIPDEEELRQAVRDVDWHCIELERSGHTYVVRLSNPHASIDLGGIAKGYIADELARTLDYADISAYLINLGGNVFARGHKPDGSNWKVGIQDPQSKDGLVGAIELEDASAVTSGVYERCFVHDGTLYHHILNPKTGNPVATDIAGVTVVAKKATDAEGYSTTLLALGSNRARSFAATHSEIDHLYLVDLSGALL